MRDGDWNKGAGAYATALSSQPQRCRCLRELCALGSACVVDGWNGTGVCVLGQSTKLVNLETVVLKRTPDPLMV